MTDRPLRVLLPRRCTLLTVAATGREGCQAVRWPPMKWIGGGSDRHAGSNAGRAAGLPSAAASRPVVGVLGAAGARSDVRCP
jgi:hypothetical protein